MKVTHKHLKNVGRTDLNEKLTWANDLATLAKICDRQGSSVIISVIESSVHGHANISMREIKKELEKMKV